MHVMMDGWLIRIIMILLLMILCISRHTRATGKARSKLCVEGTVQTKGPEIENTVQLIFAHRIIIGNVICWA